MRTRHAVDEEVDALGIVQRGGCTWRCTRRQMCLTGYGEADLLGIVQGGGCAGLVTRRQTRWAVYEDMDMMGGV